jgi:hypothetical protein
MGATVKTLFKMTLGGQLAQISSPDPQRGEDHPDGQARLSKPAIAICHLGGCQEKSTIFPWFALRSLC